MEVQELRIVRFCCMHNYCGKYFTTRFNLKRHTEIVHQNFKRYKCDKCFKLFASKKNLIEHSYLHTGARPYKCEECEMTFRHLSFLCLHRRAHIAKGSIDMMDDLGGGLI